MISIFSIGTDLLDGKFQRSLSAKDIHVIRFKSLDQAKSYTKIFPDVIVVDKDERRSPSFREFTAAFRRVPMIVISRDDSFRGFGIWKKLFSVYPLCAPSTEEIMFYLEKAFREKRLASELTRLKKNLSHAKQELDYFEAVSKTLTSTLDLNEILTAIMKEAKKLIKAEAWSVLLLDEESGELYFTRADGQRKSKDRIQKMRLKLGEGIAGWVAKEGVPVVVPDVSIDPRFCARVDKAIDYRTKTLICVPIRTKSRILGVLEIINKTTNEPFTKDDLDLMMKLVDQAAIAVERASIYQKMADLSVTDDLTKLFNSRYLHRTLEVEISRATRYRTSISLIFMDIDYFKTVNDNYGHLVGSKILVEMGQVIIQCIRSIDIVARYGGDEFVIVLPQTTPQSGFEIAERIRKRIEGTVFLKKEGYSLRLTASFGVASYPDSAKTKEELLQLADDAMYRVKNKTRNGVYAIL